MDVETMKTYKPFVSDEVIEDCQNQLKKVWRCTEYEQLLEEVEVMADKEAKDKATKKMQRRYRGVQDELKILEAKAGDNKVWWAQWTTDVDEGDLYPNIDLDWYNRNIPGVCNVIVKLFLKACEAAKADKQLSPEEQILLGSHPSLCGMCMEVCNWIGIENVLSTGGDGLVTMHLEALCLYIALRNELDKLNEQAKRHGIRLNEQPSNEQKRKKDNRSNSGEVSLSPEVIRIFDAAVEDGRFMEKNGDEYKWIYGGGNPTKLCFFVLEIYKTERPPWKQLQTLFARTEILRTLASQLKARKWYSKGKLTKWAKEIRDFIESVKPTKEAPQVKQQQATTPMQTPPRASNEIEEALKQEWWWGQISPNS